MGIYATCIAIIICVYRYGVCEPVAEKNVMMEITNAKNASEIEWISRNVKLEGHDKQHFIRGMILKKESEPHFVLNKSLEVFITASMADKDALVVSEAARAAGRYKIASARRLVCELATNADKISPMYANDIRQAGIFALLEIGGDGLGPVFNTLLEKRRSHWFDGDLPMILQGLSIYGDQATLVQLGYLQSQVQEYLEHAAKDDFRIPQCRQLLDMISQVEHHINPQQKE